MVIFESEAALVAALSLHDDLIRQCASGQLSFDEFCEKYEDFYAFHALDGHESDEQELALLEKYEARIEPHRIIAVEILGQVCSDENAKLEIYKKAGRFGSEEAVSRLRGIKLQEN
ncbi:MAG: hypothetical protein KF892_24295 [Rhizobacter sp.]|nr:hypothetical protein [Rhizobacter sp.]